MDWETSLSQVVNAIVADDVRELRNQTDWIEENDSLRIQGMPLICIAVANGSLDALDYLVAHGQDVRFADSDGDGLVILASAGGNVGWTRPQMIRKLLSFGLDVNLQNHNGSTALMLVSAMGYEDAVETLLDCGANVHIRDRQGKNAVHYTTMSPGMQAPSTAVIKLLSEHGANAEDIYDYDCCFALFNPMRSPMPQMVPRRRYSDAIISSPDVVAARVSKSAADYDYLFAR